MREREEKPGIDLGLDRERIKSVLQEAYKSCGEMLGVEFAISSEQFVASVNLYVESNRVSIPVALHLPSKQYPELVIEVNLRRKSVFARMISRKKQAYLNKFLGIL